MLQSIRDKAQGWIAWAIIIFISIPFALWGIQSYLGVGGEPISATVDDVEITDQQVDERVREFRERMRDQLGENYRADLFDDQTIRSRVVEQLVNEEVLRSSAKDWQLRVGDESVIGFIQTIPGFQRNGRFDPQVYDMSLRNQGMSQRGFEHLVRDEYVTNQMRDAIVDSAFVTKRELADKVRLEEQQRDIDYLIIPTSHFLGQITPSEEELKKHYQAHTTEYLVPERVKLEYILLDLDQVADKIEVEEAVLRDYFEGHRDEYQVPEERNVSHILIQAESEGETEQALKKSEDLLQKLRDGADFAELAKQHSDDPGSASQGGSLGWISKGIMDEKFEDAAFSLQAGVVSEPVRSAFGYHLIRVEELRAGGDGTFEEFKEEVSTAYRRAEAENQFFDFTERLANLAYDTPDSLMPAAEVLGLEVKTSDWVSRNGGMPGLRSAKITSAAFSDDVLKDGNNSEMIELGPERVIVVRVLQHEEEHISPYEEVEAKVAASLKNKIAAEKTKTAGEQLLQKVEEGSDISTEAGQYGGALVNTGLIGSFGSSHPAEVVRRGFQMQDKGVYQGVEMKNGDYAVLALKSIKDGDVSILEETVAKSTKDRLQSTFGNQDFISLTAGLRDQAEVEVR